MEKKLQAVGKSRSSCRKRRSWNTKTGSETENKRTAFVANKSKTKPKDNFVTLHTRNGFVKAVFATQIMASEKSDCNIHKSPPSMEQSAEQMWKIFKAYRQNIEREAR